ncbi:hypothetical protein TcasGA2_TC016388 [Tribolium castaneum]|uniref:Uncharacterized protein n=1 Tax=Tribolium castaneum TaxID=7070 RepID=D7ELV5_TRICA|nr:hypothetical protein TcasGA2_TC016388 [Tribolium castaneum]
MGAYENDKTWDENISNIQLGLNGTVNQAIGVAPSEALMGYRVISQGMLEPDDREVVDVTEVRARMERHNDHYQAEQKQRFDSKRKPGHLYSEGDLVLIKITSTPATGASHKLLPKWRGPFRITKVLGNDRYEVADIPGSCRSRLRYSGVAGVDNMRPWIYCE